MADVIAKSSIDFQTNREQGELRYVACPVSALVPPISLVAVGLL